jgi:hypothetical protein
MVINSRRSNGSKSSRGVYKIVSLAAEPYLTSACTPLPIESRRTPPSPLPTTPRRRSPPRRTGTPLPTAPRRRSTVSTPQQARFIMAGSGGSINDDLRHCGFVPDDDDGDGDGDGGPYTQPTTTSAPAPLLPPEGALRQAPLAPTLVLVAPPRGRGC